MFKVLGAFTGRGGSPSEVQQDEKTKLILNQAHDFEIALKAMDYVLDDRVQEGLDLLKRNESSSGPDQTIMVLARGVIEFLEATLGFEGEAMKRAASTLAKAEELSLKSRQNSQRMGLRGSSFYPPGTVYAVTYTESCLLHALVMLFSESMMEAAKALLKLRKAYSMLQEILDAIKKVEKSRASPEIDSNGSQASFVSAESDFTSADIPYNLSPKEQEDRELLEYATQIQKMREKRLCGAHIGNSPAVNRLRTELGLHAMKDLPKEEIKEYMQISPDLDVSQATLDEFILSGVNLCFGILQVVLSLIPPAIGAVLSIVGFHGSREEGLRLAWRSTKYRNVHGCIGLQALMFYYDGPFQFTDVDFDIPVATSGKPSKSSAGRGDMDGPTLLHPGKILENALLQSRALFPNSALWLLNEARMLATKGELEEAVHLMDSIDIEKIQMRQVKSLLVFDRAIILSQMHDYERAAEDLLSLLKISDWSHAFYTYYAGACYLEKWRMCQMGLVDTEKADFYKKKAKELIFGAPNLLGKKTFKSKNLPLDRFMLRKVEQFGNMQKSLKLSDPLDAIATSPIQEIAYFYNGYNRMTKDGLELTKKLLTEYHNPAIDCKNTDQEMIKNFLVSLTLRRLGETQQGCELLDKKVLPQFFSLTNGKVKYVKKTEDPWLYPAALYERALFTWRLQNMKGLPESREWLLRAQGYAVDYELSTRIGMKIKAALDRVEHSLNL
ncbi:probable Mitochondrial outer membrane protein SCY_3392 [Zygosaccharomyces bailii]|nr:probable Mitochondrial outer membrane protein SCY_3392 [Zygosaccharomyces bailii]